MTRRFLAIISVPLIATTAYALWAFDHRWIGQWAWTIDSITGSTVLTGPLVAALTAWALMEASRLKPITSSTSRVREIPWRLALEVWVVAVAVYVVAAVVALAITAFADHGGPFQVWVLAIGPAVLAVCALVGAVAGHLAPYRLTSILIGAGVFFFGAFAASPFADLLRHGPSSGSLGGLQFDSGVWLLQFLALIGIAVALIGLLPMLAGQRRGAVLPVIVAAGVVLAVGAAIAVGNGGSSDRRFEASGEGPTACAGDAPEVCVAPSDKVLLKRTAEAMDQGAEKMRAKGLNPPARYEYTLPGREASKDAGVLIRLAPYGSSNDKSWIWTNLLTPAGCEFWTDSSQAPSDQVFEAQALLEAWIVKGVDASKTAWSDQARAWLATSNEPAAKSWAVSTFKALENCTPDAIKLPYSVLN